jgi:NAD(P)-dependent dehydrogenase (short-subunit alcohol dehydrogenase family)
MKTLTNGRVVGKVALVTGAASNPGLGHSVALTLAAEGAQLVVTDIDLQGVELCADEINAAGGKAIAMRQDVTSESDWQTVIAAAIERFGRLDVLVNNAGIGILLPIADLTLEQWNRQIEVNLTSVFLGCKYTVPEMRENGGSIINMSSVTGLKGLPRGGAYGASKGGMRILSKALAVEEARHNIRCNTIHPGVIWTNMQAQNLGLDNPNDADFGRYGIPLRRHGEPQEVANMALFLASDESSYVTGTEFVIDGGMTI